MIDEYLTHTCTLYSEISYTKEGDISLTGEITNVPCRYARDEQQVIQANGTTYISAGVMHFNGDQDIRAGMAVEVQSNVDLEPGTYFIIETSQTQDLDSANVILNYAVIARQPFV